MNKEKKLKQFERFSTRKSAKSSVHRSTEKHIDGRMDGESHVSVRGVEERVDAWAVTVAFVVWQVCEL